MILDDEDEDGYENYEDWGNLILPGEVGYTPGTSSPRVSNIPPDVFKRDLEEAREFAVCLKATTIQSSIRKMAVGEIPRSFSCFHYPETNHSVPPNHDKHKIVRSRLNYMEFIDSEDKTKIFRWDLLGVLVKPFIYVSDYYIYLSSSEFSNKACLFYFLSYCSRLGNQLVLLRLLLRLHTRLQGAKRRRRQQRGNVLLGCFIPCVSWRMMMATMTMS